MQLTEYVTVSVTAPAPAPKAAPAKGRDRYLDALRAVAIFRVVFYHGFAFSWLPWIPAMGIMFALAGSLMVRSIDKSPKQAVISRFRRLVPVVWAFGLIWIPLMIWHDGAPSTWMGEGTTPIPVWQNIFWILPAGDPPGSHWGEISWGVLWYLKTYLWFVALSPILLWAFRRRSWTPWLVLALPFLLMLAADQGFIPSNGWYGSTLYDALTYGGCWLIGFAHGTGLLKRLPIWLLVTIGAAVAGGGLLYMAGPGNAEILDEGGKPWALEGCALALAMYSFGIVFILMRFSSRMEWLKKHPIVDRVITIMNARAVTIYLWHNTALKLASMASEHFGIYPWYFWFPLTWVLIFGFVLAFGWVEDFAARRKPELLPGKKKKPDPAAAAAAEAAAAAAAEPKPTAEPLTAEQTAVGGWAPVSPVDGYRGEPRYADARHGDGRYGDNRYGDDRRGDDRYGDDRRGGDRYGDGRYGDDRSRDDRSRDDRYDDRRYRDDQYGDRRYQDARYGDARYGDARYPDSRQQDAPPQRDRYQGDPYREQAPRDYPPRDYDPRSRDYDPRSRDAGQNYPDQRYPEQRRDEPRPAADYDQGRRYAPQEYGGQDAQRGQRFPSQQYGTGQPPAETRPTFDGRQPSRRPDPDEQPNPEWQSRPR